MDLLLHLCMLMAGRPWPRCLSASKYRTCVFTCGAHHTDALRAANCATRTCVCVCRRFFSPLFDLDKDILFPAFPQTPFPFSLDVFILGLMQQKTRDIIYCLFSKANVQSWQISFAEHIIIKIQVFSCFFYHFTLCEGISDSCPYREFLDYNKLRMQNLLLLGVTSEG